MLHDSCMKIRKIKGAVLGKLSLSIELSLHVLYLIVIGYHGETRPEVQWQFRGFIPFIYFHYFVRCAVAYVGYPNYSFLSLNDCKFCKLNRKTLAHSHRISHNIFISLSTLNESKISKFSARPTDLQKPNKIVNKNYFEKCAKNIEW